MVSSFSPPPSPASNDSEPAPAPSLPSDPALWGEADMHAMRGPAAAFSTQTPDPADQRHPTIGHIGRYALKHRLGEGGLGTVYAAHDPLLSRLIAVKTLNVEIEESERGAFNSMFLNEARAAAGLNHTHIVTVFDAGVSDNRAYIAMELLKGRDLRQLRQEGWRATHAQAALIVRRVADALGYAHSKGVVHRDVKPANIFMIGRTQPKVLDFGIARIAHRHDVHADAELAAGSPYYMAPEQARQEPVDRRADVFSLGVVLYELLTDVKPFRGTTLEEITDAVLNHEPPLASAVEPSVPVALAEIAAKALAKNPEHRYRSARAFSRDLRHWLDENTSSAADADAPVQSSPKSRGLLWVVAGVAGAAVLGGLIWAAVTPKPAVERTAPAAASAVATQPASTPVVTPTPGSTAGAVAPAVAIPEPVPAVVEAPSAPMVKSISVPAAVKGTAPPAKETPKERRAREARERDARTGASPAPSAAPARGLVRIAISPWGEVEVDGKPAGTSPPLTDLSLPEGRHQIVIRNTDLPAHTAVVNVTADQPVTLKHKF